MNRFYLINIQHLSNGQIAKEVFDYGNRAECMSAYHNTLLYNYSAQDVIRFTVSVMDENGPMVWENFDKTPDEIYAEEGEE